MDPLVAFSLPNDHHVVHMHYTQWDAEYDQRSTIVVSKLKVIQATTEPDFSFVFILCGISVFLMKVDFVVLDSVSSSSVEQRLQNRGRQFSRGWGGAGDHAPSQRYACLNCMYIRQYYKFAQKTACLSEWRGRTFVSSSSQTVTWRQTGSTLNSDLQ